MNERKVCGKCVKEKDLSKFSFRNKNKGTRCNWCKDCVKSYDSSSYSNESRKKSVRKAAKASQGRLRKFITEYKKENKCVKCDEDRYYVLDFHHKSDKKYTIASAAQRGISVKTLIKEINKCELLCANCHREIHFLQNEPVA